LGHLPGLPVAGGPQIAYGEINSSSLWRSHEGIKTYTEEVGTDHVSIIRQTLQKADKIVFLGFQFHRQNMDILFDGGWPRDRDVFSTMYQLSVRSTNRVVNAMHSNGNRHTVEAVTCSEFMRLHWEEIFEDD
jgi:hypothetical protein